MLLFFWSMLVIVTYRKTYVIVAGDLLKTVSRKATHLSKHGQVDPSFIDSEELITLPWYYMTTRSFYNISN